MGRLRGRTFNNAFVILDEAQNTTVGKMRMAVTRVGRGARIVITGDPNQTDLYEKETSGLAHLLRIIEGTDIASVHRFENKEVVRSNLVRRLEELYSQSAAADGT